MSSSVIQPALKPVVQAFKSLGISYYIGGSVASSNYGIPRSTLDIDIVVDLSLTQVSELVNRLKDEYYIDQDVIISALKHKSSFNIIHFETMVKIDIFCLKGRAFDRDSFKRKRLDTLVNDPANDQYYFASPEDIIINKLEWYQMGGGVSERQWKDILGIFKMQGELLDIEYLKKWAEVLGLLDLLQKTMEEGILNPMKAT